MRYRLVAYSMTVVCGLCLLMGLSEKSQASNKGNGLLGAVGQVKGEQGIAFIMKEGEGLHLQGNQKWQIEFAKQLGKAAFAIKDVLNATKSGAQVDNALAVAATCEVTDGLHGKYTGTKVFRLTDIKDASYKGFEHRLDAWYSCPEISANMMLKILSRMYDDMSSANYQTNIYQTALVGSVGIWGHRITLKVETQRYPHNTFRDYALRDILYGGKMSLARFAVDTTLQREVKKYVKNRYDGYEKRLLGLSLLGSMNMKNDLKVTAEYLDRVVPGKLDKRYIKTTISGSGTILVLNDITSQLELDYVSLSYPHLIPEEASGDYIQRKGKLSFNRQVLESTKVGAYYGIDIKEFICLSKSNAHKRSCGLSIEYRKDTNAKTVASFERQVSIPQKTAGIKLQVKHTQQVDKGLEYELTYSKDSNAKESSVSVRVKHSM
jgi:hypothetical protein